MSVTQYITNSAVKDDDTVFEITLNDIINFFRKGRRTIVVVTLVGSVIGVLYAFSKPDLYTSQVTVMPEVEAKGTGGFSSLGSLAGLAGVNIDNLGAQSDAIRPELYTNIIGSIPFALKLLGQPVYSQKLKTKTTLQNFIEHSEDNKLVSRFQKLFAGEAKNTTAVKRPVPQDFSQVLQLTSEQDGLIKSVQNSIETAYEKKTGIVTITATETDPFIAATVAHLSLEYLTNYIVTYRTEKARRQVDFLVQRVADAQGRYKLAEYAVSAYRDRNRNLFLNTAKIDEQRLQSDYLLAQSVYTDLSKQLEQARIKVQEETPVFKILEPPTVPLQKSGPKRTVIILGFAIFGALLSVLILFIRHLKV